jgi:hypothetical protein
MEQIQWLDAVERFWLELVGTVVPGAFLLVPIAFAMTPLFPAKLPIPPSSSFDWAVLIVGSFAAGHVISSLGVWLVDRLAARLLAFMNLHSYERIIEDIVKSESFQICERDSGLSHAGVATARRLMQVRDFVLSTLKESDRHTTYRFRFLSLFNRGVATSIVVVGFVVVALAWWYPEISLTRGDRIVLVLAALAVPFLLERASYFQAVTLRVPFSMRLGDLYGTARADAASPESSASSHKRVYLAGGFHSGWQDRVIQSVEGFKWLDPRKHGMQAAAAYTDWDLQAIRACDILLAHAESTNPGLYSLALEIGFARAINKKIILVVPADIAPSTKKYLSMCEAVANVTVFTLEEAIGLLRETKELGA